MKKYAGSFFKKLGLVIAFLGFSLSGIYAASEVKPLNFIDITTRKEFTSADQKSGQFKVSGIDKPLLIKIDPSDMKLEVITCKIENALISQPEATEPFDSKNLTVLRFTQFNVDTNKKVDRIYKGHRETRFEKFFEEFLKLIKLYPTNPYPGTLLVDEYLECLPMKWTFKDIESFQAVKSYLQQKFIENNIAPLEEKPLLLISFKKSNQNFTADDINFLETYYAPLDPQNPSVKEFFKDHQTIIDDARNDTREAKNKNESIGEQLFRLTEKELGAGSLKIRDILMVFIVIGLPAKFIKDQYKKFTKVLTEEQKQTKPELGSEKNPMSVKIV